MFGIQCFHILISNVTQHFPKRWPWILYNVIYDKTRFNLLSTTVCSVDSQWGYRKVIILCRKEIHNPNITLGKKKRIVKKNRSTPTLRNWNDQDLCNLEHFFQQFVRYNWQVEIELIQTTHNDPDSKKVSKKSDFIWKYIIDFQVSTHCMCILKYLCAKITWFF